MAAEVENPPVTAEEKQEAPAAPAVEAPVVEEAKEAAPPAEEVKEAVVIKEAAPKKLNVFKQNFEKDVVYLYQFARTTSLPSLSPYVLKVETWLRLTGLKYEVRESRRYSSRHNPFNVNPEYLCRWRSCGTASVLIGINWIWWSNDPQSSLVDISFSGNKSKQKRFHSAAINFQLTHLVTQSSQENLFNVHSIPIMKHQLYSSYRYSLSLPSFPSLRTDTGKYILDDNDQLVGGN